IRRSLPSSVTGCCHKRSARFFSCAGRKGRLETMNRREFLRSSMTLTGAAAVAGSSGVSWADTSKRALGVQLYTVRDQAEKDLPSVLGAIRNIGYQEVETYWNVYTHPAPELKRMCNDHGLHVPSGHFNYDGLEAKFEYAAELGVV